MILKEIFRVKLVRIHAIFREKNTFSKKFFRVDPQLLEVLVVNAVVFLNSLG